MAEYNNPPPIKSPNSNMVIAGVIAVIVIIAIVFYMTRGGADVETTDVDETPATVVETAPPDTDDEVVATEIEDGSTDAEPTATATAGG